MRKWLLIVIILLLVGCTPKETIKIGVHNWPPCEVWYVAEELDYFDDLDVELIRFSTWTDNMSSLYKGNIDITHATYYDAVYYSDKGEEGIILAPIDYIEGVEGLVVKKNITEFVDLKGKTIGVETGTDEHFLLSNALEKNNISMEDVQIRSLSSFSSVEQFVNNEIDALFTYEPYLTRAVEDGNGRIIFSSTALPNYRTDVIVALKDLDKNKEYQKIMIAWYKALDYIKENPDEAYEIMAKNEDMSLDSFAQFYERFNFYNKDEAIEILENDYIINRLNEIQSYTQEHELTNKVIDVYSILESPLLEMKTDEDK